jgi:hypothetical protein
MRAKNGVMAHIPNSEDHTQAETASIYDEPRHYVDMVVPESILNQIYRYGIVTKKNEGWQRLDSRL